MPMKKIEEQKIEKVKKSEEGAIEKIAEALIFIAKEIRQKEIASNLCSPFFVKNYENKNN